MFVIWNHTQRAFVAWPGEPSSYTRLLQNARRFPSLEAAQRECCGDESVKQY